MTSKDMFNKIAREEVVCRKAEEKSQKREDDKRQKVMESLKSSKNMTERNLQIIKESERKIEDLKNLIYDLLIILEQSCDASVNLYERDEHIMPCAFSRDDGDVEIRVFNDEELYQFIDSILEQY